VGEFCYCGHAAAVVSKPRVENRRFFIFVAPNFSLFFYIVQRGQGYQQSLFRYRKSIKIIQVKAINKPNI
jgi:hypothetical protein